MKSRLPGIPNVDSRFRSTFPRSRDYSLGSFELRSIFLLAYDRVYSLQLGWFAFQVDIPAQSRLPGIPTTDLGSANRSIFLYNRDYSLGWLAFKVKKHSHTIQSISLQSGWFVFQVNIPVELSLFLSTVCWLAFVSRPIFNIPVQPKLFSWD